MKKFLFVLALVLMPSLAFAATDDQIQASLTQQLLSIFVVQVNGIDKMQSLVAQSSNPAQFNVFSGILAQQLSETTAEIANLLNPSNSPIPSSAVTNGIGGPSTLTDAQTCAPVPSLTLDVVATTSNSVELRGTYATGCNLDESTKWTFKTDLWNITGAKRDYDYGTIGHANEWDLQGPEGTNIYTVAYYGTVITPYVGQKMATLTVGSLTATTTISNK